MSFIVWVVSTGAHVLGHLPRLFPSLRAARRANVQLPHLEPGRAGRSIALTGALAGGLVLVVVLIPDFAPWTQHGVLSHLRGER